MSIPTTWKVEGNSRGGGGALVVKELKGKYETKLKCVRGGGGGKNRCRGVLDIF